MSITTGVGLLSGLPIAEIIDSLMNIEARPKTQLETRVSEVKAQRTAFLELSARLRAIKNAAARFDELSFFRSSKATSSDANVLSATAAEGAVAGTYSFQVHSLVTNHQLISAGFADGDETPVGGGVMTLELGEGSLNPATSLDLLNDQRGVQRGTVRVTDRSGRTADIDLTTALTVDDVLEAFNSRTDIRVEASVRGDQIVVRDTSGGTGVFAVSDLGRGQTASDLGIAAAVDGNEIVGNPVLALGSGTALGVLNDGNGVRRHGTADDFELVLGSGKRLRVSLSSRLDFATNLSQLNNGQGVRLGTIRVTNRAGQSAEVDLTSARSLQDISDRIGAAEDDSGQSLNVSVGLVNSSLQIIDGSVTEGQTATSNLIIEDVSGFAAQDLGILVDTESAGARGAEIHRVRTIGDVLRAITYAREVDAEGKTVAGQYNDGALVASVSADGARLVLTDTTGGPTTITRLNNSQAAVDLGILDAETGQLASNRILAGLNTVLLKSLNGGSGVRTGAIEITAGDGTITSIDLSGAETVQDLLDAFNADSAMTKVRAELSEAGLGIVVRDLSGGSGALAINDLSGHAAEDLHLNTSAAGQLSSGNLQRRYINETTTLASLNGKEGVRFGQFRITNSAGLTQTVTLDGTRHESIGDVLKEINGLSGFGVVARINDTGDGIVLEDSAGGGGLLKVEDVGTGQTAADLNIAGEAAEGETAIDGSYELRITVDVGDTLSDVADKIRAATDRVSVSVINDGSQVAPYRLSIASRVQGTPGRVLIDGGGTGLSFATLVEAKDAMVFFGPADSPNSIRLISSTNTLTGFVKGVTVNLTGTSDKAVEVTVAKDVDKLVNDAKVFVETFNDVIDRINALTKYDETSNTRGLLMSDSAVNTIRDRLYRMITSSV
ncbi:MAG: flagellar filament capping protein FliD, partial [Phycisphaerae bacterium]|nr:flagellar filament capping protein FliD [Phycisphaerae bacterium]